MKKTLLGTTALVTAGLLSGPALAADPIELSLGGWFYMAPTAVIAEDSIGADTSNTFGFTKDYEITFDGRTTLDNGITVGFHMELETPRNGGTNLRQDEQYIFVSGGFGEVRLGSIDGTTRDLGSGVAGCSMFSLCGQYQTTNFARETGAAQGTGYVAINRNIAANDVERIYYFSPRIAGLQFRASYGPDGAQGKSDGNNQPSLNTNTNDLFDFGLNFSNSFGGVSVSAAANYGFADSANATTGNAGNADADPEGWNARASVGVAGFTVAGGYQHIANGGVRFGGPVGGSDYEAWVVSGGYATGPVGVQIDYGQSVQGDGTGSDDYLQNINLAGNYDLGPGVTFDAGLNYTSGSAGTGNYESYAIGAGLQISF